MSELLKGSFAADSLMPDGAEHLTDPGLVSLHGFSDGLTAIAYLALPIAVLYFARKRRDVPFSWKYFCIGLFIVACGASHLVALCTRWTPTSWFAGLIEAATALTSVLTAIVLTRLLLKAFAPPTIQAVVDGPTQQRDEPDLLDTRIRERTAELTQKNTELSLEIAARKRAEAACRMSEARFKRLADSGIIGIMIADTDGRVLDTNQTLVDMLGYTRSDVAAGNIRWTDLTPPEWFDLDTRAAEQLKATGVAPLLEKEFFRKDGSRVPVLLGATRLEGPTTETVTFILDLSEQKRAEAAIGRLRQQHEADIRFRALVDTAPDAIVVTGEDGRITLVNVRTETLFGYERAELIGQHLELLIPERFRAGHVAHLVEFFKRPSVRSMGSGLELYGRRKDGTELPIEVSLSPQRDQDQMTVSAAVRDMSERKRLEADAKLLTDRLTSAVEAIQDAFALFDDRDRLVLCNSVYRNLIGATVSGPLVGQRYEDLLNGWLRDIWFANEDERAEFRARRLAQRHHEMATFELRLRDGRSLRVTDRRTPEGGTVKTIWDMTADVCIAEELREARAAAEAASSAKSDFLSSMSHELRTPLNAILGFAQLLQRDQKEPLSERHRSRVGQILQGGEHLLHLIDDILDLSRIESGAVAIDIEALNVLEILEQVKSTLEPLAMRHGIQIEFVAAPPDLPLVAADRVRFAQILMNFGSNAIKYNRPQGRVTLRVSKDAEHVRVAIEDTGIGIGADQQNKLFQPFQRAGQETGSIEGTGIGLFITKRLAELMDASVGFRSVENEGSEFWVEVPIHLAAVGMKSTASAHDPARAASAAAPCRSILYVEDNVANVAFMTDLVGGLDSMTMSSAPTAELGIEMARSQSPDVIIMDINLPGLSGFDALRALRESPNTRHIPVIALTAAASERERERGLQAGFDHYLTKPVKVDEMVKLLETLLHGA